MYSVLWVRLSFTHARNDSTQTRTARRARSIRRYEAAGRRVKADASDTRSTCETEQAKLQACNVRATRDATNLRAVSSVTSLTPSRFNLPSTNTLFSHSTYFFSASRFSDPAMVAMHRVFVLSSRKSPAGLEAVSHKHLSKTTLEWSHFRLRSR